VLAPAADWASLELRHLHAFVAVVEEGSFHAAAGRLGYSQPGISHQIAALERIVGARLLARHGRSRVTTTCAGASLLPHARELIRRSRAASLELAALPSPSRADT
jgi:DNA-binding transcriptional LysR family regulator